MFCNAAVVLVIVAISGNAVTADTCCRRLMACLYPADDPDANRTQLTQSIAAVANVALEEHTAPQQPGDDRTERLFDRRHMVPANAPMFDLNRVGFPNEEAYLDHLSDFYRELGSRSFKAFATPQPFQYNKVDQNTHQHTDPESELRRAGPPNVLSPRQPVRGAVLETHMEEDELSYLDEHAMQIESDSHSVQSNRVVSPTHAVGQSVVWQSNDVRQSVKTRSNFPVDPQSSIKIADRVNETDG